MWRDGGKWAWACRLNHDVGIMYVFYAQVHMYMCAYFCTCVPIYARMASRRLQHHIGGEAIDARASAVELASLRRCERYVHAARPQPRAVDTGRSEALK